MIVPCCSWNVKLTKYPDKPSHPGGMEKVNETLCQLMWFHQYAWIRNDSWRYTYLRVYDNTCLM